jgi:hypothetical protein
VAPERKLGRHAGLITEGAVKDKIDGTLRLRGSLDQKLAIIVKSSLIISRKA